MATPIPGERFIRTLRNYLEVNERRLLSSAVQSNFIPTTQSPIIKEEEGEEEEEESNGFMKTVSSLWSDNSTSSSTTARSTGTNSLYGISIPYMSSLITTNPTLSTSNKIISSTPFMPVRSTLTLDIHYLYFLLVQFEYLGLEETRLPVPEPYGLVETEATTTGKAPSIKTVGSIMSTLSLSTGWQFWSQHNKSEEGRIQEDIVYIHRYFSKITALKLQMNLSTDTERGVTRSGQRTIRGYENPLPQDGSIALSLKCFKNLKYLEIQHIHPRCIADWSDLQSSLISLIVKSSQLDNATDIINCNTTPWSELKMLSLADNSLTTLENESAQLLRNVNHLNLSSNLLIDIPAALASLYNLSCLNLSYNMISFTTAVNTVLGNIQELDLRGNRLTVLAGLDRLWALERLDVRDNRIEDAAEIGRLTSLPNINMIWVEGNPFTKSQSDYRVEIFTLFKKNDLDIQLDGSAPTFVERRRIQVTNKDRSVNTPTISATIATEAISSKDKDNTVITSPKHNEKAKIVRAKAKNNKRQIRLGKLKEEKESMIPIPTSIIEENNNKKHVHRLTELEESVQQEAANSRRAQSVRSHKYSKKKPEIITKVSDDSESSKRSSELFRDKIEAMRREAGTEWLRCIEKILFRMQTFAQKLTYDVALWIFNIMIDIFFREVKTRGSYKIPKEGPVIFVAAPHANQFVDPIILMRECKRRVSFLIAEKSMHQKTISFFARMISAIPVIRPQDRAKPGEGYIQLLNRKTDPLRITGIHTQFTVQLKPRDSILLPKGAGNAEVVQVISDTEIIIKKEFKDLKALELLTQTEGTCYKYMPHIDQSTVYQSVHDELNNGRCITIFPEGGSHDRAEMLPLKAGVTLMALGAMAKYEGLDVKIVPCGLNYFHAHRFRSRAVIEFGKPITISSELVKKFKQGGDLKREACSSLLDSIYNALKTVTINAGSYETLMLIQAARRLYKPAHKKLHLSQVVDLNRRFLIGYNLFKDDPKVIELQQKVMAYNQLLKYHGIQDHQVSKTNKENNGRLLWLLIKRIFILIILTLWVFPGTILNLPVVIVARVISQNKAQAALKSSTIKIAGRDVLATWKLLVGLVLLPTLYAFYSLIIFIIVLQTELEFKWKLILPIATWNLLPFISYASLRFGEIGHDILKSIQPTVMALLDPKGAETLRQIREKLSSDITELINEYGPKVFSDFDANYISKTTEPSISRTSSATSLLWASAPSKLPKIASGFFQQVKRMNWLDDKTIFNWSRAEDYASDIADDVLYFLDKFSGRSRSGSVSESDSRPISRNRSRVNSFSSSDGEFIKVEAMTSLPTHHSTSSNMLYHNTSDTNTSKTMLTSRVIFRIDDVDEEEEERELDDLAVTEGRQQQRETKKDI
ncbi:uncharacterized protein BX663DRAFT_530203 [Cokeromyces recurvatus]|uniref:uncharacterized protein n=1 Tax=Cokeromyces recurvatus TaxID=90255 RepID=UPI0022200228|nr:uncharacterized protein BX663DRAFT_530203 [Cokeromyces recurvatus]KAI7904725.1 hypothetical protein BX663DRAFT_530203 [Cokeromyces recurvatus]